MAIMVPGAACEVLLDPVLFLGALFVAGSATVQQTIPSDPGLVGVRFFGQALGFSPSNAITVSN